MKFFNRNGQIIVPIQSIHSGKIEIIQNKLTFKLAPNGDDGLALVSIIASYDLCKREEDMFNDFQYNTYVLPDNKYQNMRNQQNKSFTEDIYNAFVKRFLSKYQTPEFQNLKCYVVTFEEQEQINKKISVEAEQNMLRYKQFNLEREKKNSLMRERIKTGKDFVQHTVRNHTDKIKKKYMEIERLKQELLALEKEKNKEMFNSRSIFEEMYKPVDDM